VARLRWHELPRTVQAAVEARTGPVTDAQDVAAGSQAHLVTILTTATGTHFCKGVHADGPALRGLRNEIRLSGWLPDSVPGLRWSSGQAGWLLAGFEYAPGRHPDLAVGSPDLPIVAATLAGLTDALTPCPTVPLQTAGARWADWIDPQLVDGDTLLHTDVTPKNFLLGDRMRVVDWSMPCRGAAWIDTARMIVRLIRAGHSPAQAEGWARTVPAWSAAPSPALDAFAAGMASLSRMRQQQHSAPHLDQLADAAEAWTRSRRAVPMQSIRITRR
jgi:hypothetical protein